MSALAASPDSGGPAITATRRVTVGLGVVLGAIAFGVLAGVLSADGKAIDVVGLAIVLLPVALWKRPYIGPIILLCTAVLFEQVVTIAPKAGFVPGIGDVLPPPDLPITSHVHVFQGLGSIHLEGADLLLFMISVVFLVRTKPADRAWPRSHVSRSMAWLLGAVVLGIFIGISHHGQMRVALMESRPYVYLAAAYLLTATLIRTRSAMRAVLWAFIIATGLKAVQGVYEFFRVMSWHPRPEAVMGHEDAYTFGVYIFLVAGLWLFNAPVGKLRKVATWILPLVIAANLFNNRRAAWLLLGGGLIVMAVIGYRCVPERRQRLKKILVGALMFSAVYIPAYWNKTGTLAQPARAIHSMISPDVRDAASNLYRTQEDANLKYNIRQGGVLGKGFGVPIDYALPIVDISKEDPNIKFIPHNGVLYIPMRMGLLGTIAFWTLLGTGIIAGCRLARSREREIAVVGSLLACSLVAYALEGATDQGFYFYRIAFITGVLLGLAEAARRIQRKTPLVVPSWPGSPRTLAAPVPAAFVPAGMAELVPVGAGDPPAWPRKPALEPLPPDHALRTRLTGLSRLRLHEPSMTPAGFHDHEARAHANARGDASGHGARTHTGGPVARTDSVSPAARATAIETPPVTIISSYLVPTDTESEVGRLLERLGPDGVVELVMLGRGSSAQPPHLAGVRSSTIKAGGPLAALASAPRLRRSLRRHRPAVVYADGDRAALISVVACLGRRTPIIWRRRDAGRRKLVSKLIARRCRSQLTEPQECDLDAILAALQGGS